MNPADPTGLQPYAIADRFDGTFRVAAQETGTSFDYLVRTAVRESDLQADLKSKTSTAAGLFQFIEQTWLELVHEEGAGLGLGAYAAAVERTRDGTYTISDETVRQDILDLRNDPATATAMAARLTKRNGDVLARRLGRPATDGELYVAHVLGAGGASKLLLAATATPGTVAADLLPAAAKANPAIFKTRDGRPRTAAEVRDLLVGRHADGPALAAQAPQASTRVTAMPTAKPAARPTTTDRELAPATGGPLVLVPPSMQPAGARTRIARAPAAPPEAPSREAVPGAAPATVATRTTPPSRLVRAAVDAPLPVAAPPRSRLVRTAAETPSTVAPAPASATPAAPPPSTRTVTPAVTMAEKVTVAAVGAPLVLLPPVPDDAAKADIVPDPASRPGVPTADAARLGAVRPKLAAAPAAVPTAPIMQPQAYDPLRGFVAKRPADAFAGLLRSDPAAAAMPAFDLGSVAFTARTNDAPGFADLMRAGGPTAETEPRDDFVLSPPGFADPTAPGPAPALPAAPAYRPTVPPKDVLPPV